MECLSGLYRPVFFDRRSLFDIHPHETMAAGRTNHFTYLHFCSSILWALLLSPCCRIILAYCLERNTVSGKVYKQLLYHPLLFQPGPVWHHRSCHAVLQFLLFSSRNQIPAQVPRLLQHPRCGPAPSGLLWARSYILCDRRYLSAILLLVILQPLLPSHRSLMSPCFSLYSLIAVRKRCPYFLIFCLSHTGYVQHGSAVFGQFYTHIY